MATSLPNFPGFDLNQDPNSLGIQWKKWILRLQNLFIALDIGNEARQKALLLHYGGIDLSDIYYTLESEEDVGFKQVKIKLDKYFEPKINVTYETYTFRQMAQAEDESIDKYVTCLREAASRCQFHDNSREIKDQVVQKCKSDMLRRKALRDDPDLDKLLSTARAMEQSDRQAKEMENAAVYRVSEKGRDFKTASYKKKDEDKQDHQEKKVCFSCGGVWPHKTRQLCPAFGSKCHKCGKKNHFTKCCKDRRRVKKVTEISDSSDTDSDGSYRVSAVQKVNSDSDSSNDYYI